MSNTAVPPGIIDIFLDPLIAVFWRLQHLCTVHVPVVCIWKAGFAKLAGNPKHGKHDVPEVLHTRYASSNSNRCW